MAVILVQPEVLPHSLESTGALARIPAMTTKGRPYLRQEAVNDPPPPVLHYLRAWREWRGWTQENLSAESGVPVSSISAYERGADTPSLEALGRLAVGLGIPRGMLLDVDPNRDPPLWASVLRALEGQQ